LAQITQLYDLACAPPEQDGRPISHWTDAELADEMMKQQFVDSISPRPGTASVPDPSGDG